VSGTTSAVRIESHGAPEALAERVVPLPAVEGDRVHLRVEAAGVNFADLLMRAGLYATVPPMPYSPGFEVAGTVVAAGPAVRSWQPGDRAVALLRYGGYARDVVVSERHLFRYPASLSAVEAATIPVVYLTAWACLIESARVRAGEIALILNAGGGVGTAAVQLARSEGLRVIGTAGDDRKRVFVTRDLGAEACFDSRAGAWPAAVEAHLGPRQIDVALDPIGGSATAACRRLLAPFGRLVFYGLSDAMPRDHRSWLRAAWAWLRTPSLHPLGLIEPNIGVHGVHLLHLAHREGQLRPALESLLERIAAGELRSVVDRTFPLTRDGAVEAHHYLHDRRNLGKVALVT
jgi:NADPH:quinone reductase-like Zn-dependent oxidoreductase